ncbi:peptidoglycan-binding domain-containing protein [Streptomyces triculaminicus]|uniref:peptidoglycan-binding domain-containing protein n=1 Tax=Streptomyces triculaminicus TaxID=2816232 RepID=UPI0037D0F29B
MRALTRTLVSVATAAGIAAGTLATAGTSFAADTTAMRPAASAEAVAPFAVNNMGLSTAEAKKLQRVLKDYWGYNGAIDGQLGTDSWKAMQRFLKDSWGYDGAIDGIVGGGTVKALQRWLKANWGYSGAIDGIAGAGTKAALKRFVDSI